MAGATNRALKAAGIPKATIATLRVEHGSGLSLRSALGIAHERGLPVGKAAEFHAAREAKRAASPAGQAAAADFRAKAATALKAAAERKAAMLAERQKRVAGTVRALGKGMLAQRKAAAVPPTKRVDLDRLRKLAADASARPYVDKSRTLSEGARMSIAMMSGNVAPAVLRERAARALAQSDRAIAKNNESRQKGILTSGEAARLNVEARAVSGAAKTALRRANDAEMSPADRQRAQLSRTLGSVGRDVLARRVEAGSPRALALVSEKYVQQQRSLLSATANPTPAQRAEVEGAERRLNEQRQVLKKLSAKGYTVNKYAGKARSGEAVDAYKGFAQQVGGRWQTVSFREATKAAGLTLAERRALGTTS